MKNKYVHYILPGPNSTRICPNVAHINYIAKMGGGGGGGTVPPAPNPVSYAYGNSHAMAHSISRRSLFTGRLYVKGPIAWNYYLRKNSGKFWKTPVAWIYHCSG